MLSSLLLAFLACLSLPLQSNPPATVWRDKHGVPHIKSSSEDSVFYALGYEHARDQLYPVQVGIRRVRGEATKYFGPGMVMIGVGGFQNVQSDWMVQYLGTYTTNVNALKAILAEPSQPADRVDQLYDDLTAFAHGMEAYRAHLAGSVLTPQEGAFRAWLQSNNLSWVYTEAIVPSDALCWGGWVRNQFAVIVAGGNDYNPNVTHILPATWQPGGGLVVDPGGSVLEALRPYFSHLPGAGSNSIAWTGEFVTDAGGTVHYSGVMADPHGGADIMHSYEGAPTDIGPSLSNHFAHLIVTGAGLDPPLDVFGYGKPGAGVFLSCQNENFAYGGSAAATNLSDNFLIRLEQDVNGLPVTYPYTVNGHAATGYKAYSYYLDTDGDNGDDAGDWFAVVPDEILVQKSSGSITVPFLRAGRFGYVPNVMPCYALAAADKMAWTIGDDGAPAGLYPSPVTVGGAVLSYPALVTHRVPADPAVDGAPHHMRFASGLYALMRASSVLDLKAEMTDHDANFAVELCAADRAGRVFASYAGAIPQRGDDVALASRPIVPGGLVTTNSLYKLDLYDKGHDGEPVPARYKADKAFDWQWSTPDAAPGSLKYLEPTDPGSSGNPSYLPFVLFDPGAGPDYPTPTSWPPVNPVAYDNPGFITASNDYVQNFCKKRSALNMTGSGYFGTFVAPDNKVLADIVKSGTAYYALDYGWTAIEKNQNIIDRFLAVKNGLYPPGSGAPLSVPGIDELVQSRRNYAALDYPGYVDQTGALVLPNGKETLPVPVRNLAELRANMTQIIADADAEIVFLRDLWGVLHGTLAASKEQVPGQTWNRYPFVVGGQTFLVNLCDLWVRNTPSPDVFWYPETTPGNPGEPQFVHMGTNGALIDFVPATVRVGHQVVASDGQAGFGASEQAHFIALVNTLSTWGQSPPPDFKNSAGSQAAALLLTYIQGFQASSNAFDEVTNTLAGCSTPGCTSDLLQKWEEGPMWTTLFNGQALASTTRFPDETWFKNGEWTAVDVSKSTPTPGVLPAFDSDEIFTAGAGAGKYVGNLVQSWAGMGLIAVPLNTWSSAAADSENLSIAGPAPLLGIQQVPYESLYKDLAHTKVKRASELSKQDINHLVTFLLSLSGDKIASAPGPTTASTKPLRYDTWFSTMYSAANGPDPKPLAPPPPYAATYPLTRNLVRLALMRRLVEADDFLQWVATQPAPPGQQQISYPPTFGDIVRTRVWGFSAPGNAGPLLFPHGTGLDANGLPCEGSAIRAIGLAPDLGTATSSGVFDGALYGTQLNRGFQRRLWTIGGSQAPILTLFPTNAPGPPLSWFWNTFGQRREWVSSPHAAEQAEAYRTAVLDDTFFVGYDLPANWSTDVGLPVTPYQITPP